MKIPYNEDLRPDTGLYNAKLGIWLFLASEVMLFGALFSAYIMLRVSDPQWSIYTIDAHTGKQILNIPLATLNTVILISSSVTMVMSWVALKMKNYEKYKLYMGLTLLCSFGFLIIKYLEYTAKFEHGLSPATNNFMAIYFTLTGLHGLHVIGGIGLNYYLWKCFKDTSIEKYSKWFIGITLLVMLYFIFTVFPTYNSDLLSASRSIDSDPILMVSMLLNFNNTKVLLSILFVIIYGLALLFARNKDYKSYAILTGSAFILAWYSMWTFYSGDSFYLILSSYEYDLFKIIGPMLLFLALPFMTFIDALMNIYKPKATFDDSPKIFTNRIEIAGLYWHFVDLVWIFLFPALYLL